jgi:hypothetical protein
VDAAVAHCLAGVGADGRNVAFGVVVSGQDTVDTVANLFQVDGKPLQDVRIADCGVLSSA